MVRELNYSLWTCSSKQFNISPTKNNIKTAELQLFDIKKNEYVAAADNWVIVTMVCLYEF